MGNLEKSTEFLTKCRENAKENGFLIPVIFSSISFGQLETAKVSVIEEFFNSTLVSKYRFQVPRKYAIF